jgi:hypothetical protein
MQCFLEQSDGALCTCKMAHSDHGSWLGAQPGLSRSKYIGTLYSMDILGLNKLECFVQFVTDFSSP